MYSQILLWQVSQRSRIDHVKSDICSQGTWKLGNLGIWRSGNLEIQNFGDLEIQKFGVHKIQNMKILKIQIHSAQNVGKVWISRKESLLAKFEAIPSQFFNGPKQIKTLTFLFGGPIDPIHPVGAAGGVSII